MSKQTQKPARKPVHTRAVAATRRSYDRMFESDGTYFLKLVVFVLLGTFWLRFKDPIEWLGTPFAALPVGMLVGCLLVRRFEPHQSDRKIWYAILLVVTIATAYSSTGVVL